MTAPRAIFISYAHEDAQAARRIADALRAFGLEVWFDSDELRGGDQWDAKIRRQIKACGLFLPIVSQTTQNRREAYFRLEWKLADDRTHMMAPGHAFIVPVVIDNTPEYEAQVPDSFTKAQFTRLIEGEPTPEFVTQVKRLAADPASPLASNSSPTPQPRPSTTNPAQPASRRKSPAPLIVAIAVTGILVAMFITMRSGQKSTEPVLPAAQKTEPPSVETAPTLDRFSIAVLPFANMSDDPSNNSFFADGIHEDLLTNLSFVPELKVVSRTSVMQYRDTTKSVREIAGELRVGTLLEGSVRRFGNQVRVTAQLIDASTDEHIWAQNYDRKLEDIFAIQGELAKAITDALRIALTDEQADAFAKRPTENLEAYELFLKEQELVEREGNTEARQWQSIAMMQKAVELDPKFAVAWANLGVLHAQAYFWNRDKTESRRELATQAIERAIKLAPEDLDVTTYVGSYFYYGFRNYTKAAEFYQKVLDVAPNHIEALASMGFIRRREGRWAESVHLHERVMELDPRHIGVATGLTTTYTMLRQWDKAVVMQQLLVDQSPGDISREYTLAGFQCSQQNSLNPYREFMARHRHLASSNQSIFWSWRWDEAVRNRDWETAIHEIENPPDDPGQGYDFSRVILYRLAGRDEESAAILNEILQKETADKQSKPDDFSPFRLGFALALLGETERALELVEEFRKTLEEKNDAMEVSYGAAMLSLVKIWTASPSEAVQTQREYLKKPGSQVFNRYNWGDDIWQYPLWGHPDYIALYEDDAAWAPLFAE